MKTVILCLCVTLIVSVVYPSINTHAAPPDHKIVYVEIFANQEQSPQFYELMGTVESELSDYGISLSVISDLPDSKKPFDQNLLVSVTSNSKSVSISSLAIFNYELPKSPILYPNFVTPMCCNGSIGLLFNNFDLNDDNLINIANYIAGIGLYQAGEYNGCEKLLKSAYKNLPKSSMGRTPKGVQSYINFYRANCAIMRDELKLAADLLESSQPFPTAEASINLAWIWIQMGDTPKAVNIINQLEYGSDWDFLKRRAQLYNLAFRYDDAITDLTTAIEHSPTNPQLYTLRGQTYLLLYEWDNVATDYDKALELDPAYADAYFYRGVLFYSILQTGQAMYDNALVDFKQYLDLAPQGEHAAEAARYADDIQLQQSALNN